jgi:hypothetical protein
VLGAAALSWSTALGWLARMGTVAAGTLDGFPAAADATALETVPVASAWLTAGSVGGVIACSAAARSALDIHVVSESVMATDAAPTTIRLADATCPRFFLGCGEVIELLGFAIVLATISPSVSAENIIVGVLALWSVASPSETSRVASSVDALTITDGAGFGCAP